MAQLAQIVQNAGVGLDPGTTSLTFCAPSRSVGGGSCLAACKLNACPATTWPPTGANSVGQTIEIDITVPFNSALAMFWPGWKPVTFMVATLGASSTDVIQF